MPGFTSRFLLALWLALASALVSATVPTVSTDGSVTTEQLDTAIEAIDARTDFDEETKSQIVASLREAQAQLRNQQAAQEAEATYAESLSTAPERTRELRARLNEPAVVPTLDSIGIDAAASLEELNQTLTRMQADLAGKEARLAEIESRIESQENRPAQARERINEIRGNQDQIATAISAEPPAGETAMLTDARKLAAELRRNALAAELARLEQELLSHGARLSLLKAQRDIAVRDVGFSDQAADLLLQLVNEKRQSAAVQAREDATTAELKAAGKHPAILELAKGNAELSAELPMVAADIERVTQELASVNEEARTIEQNLARSKQRLAIGGINQVIGRLLVEERENLPKLSRYRAQVRERQYALSEIGLAQVRIEEQEGDLVPLNRTVDATMAEVGEEVADPEELARIREEVEELLKGRRLLLQQADRTYTSYLRVLGDLDVAQRRLLSVADDYKEFLDRHLLWIPSASIYGVADIENTPSATTWALSPQSWASALQATLQSLRDSPVRATGALLLLLITIAARRPLGRRYKKLNEKIGRLSSDHIGLTVGAMAIAAVQALPLPLALYIIGLALEASLYLSDFTTSAAYAFKGVAPFLYNLLLYRRLCASQGVMQVHFLWSDDSLVVMRRQLARLILVGAPILFFSILLYTSPNPDYRESLGRLGFVTLMVILSISLHPIAHPTKGVVSAFYAREKKSWVTRLRWLWYSTAVGGPAALALTSLIGFFYTAATLTGHLIETFWLVLGIIVANLVVLRWLALERRKLAWLRLLEEREARLAEKAAAGEGDAEEEPPTVASKPLDLDAVDQQTRRLLHAGLTLCGVLVAWGIWSDIFPALGILEQVSVWSRTMMVDGVQTLSPVTLADLLLAVIVIAVTFVASRNLPGLTEIALLQYLDLQSGSRYTINAILRYIVVTIGVIAVLNIIGLNWSKIQWLVAALSVGLGFGLQEIVANFFSGLIILFERPVRVGDTITVGQLTGTVSKVRIRATTITDWDRKEIIVPNKAFITEQVVNWTLSDPITRVVIPVGVSYGSDVQLATRVMEQALANMPLVLDEPEPKVYFMGFGDSSLNFNLYVFSRQLADRLPLMHAVHEQILAALRENGIEIPFPQRDLHVKSVAKDVKDVVRGRDSENEE